MVDITRFTMKDTFMVSNCLYFKVKIYSILLPKKKPLSQSVKLETVKFLNDIHLDFEGTAINLNLFCKEVICK